MARSFLCLLALAVAGATAISIPSSAIQSPPLSVRDTGSLTKGCENGPTSRQCWGEYDINTNYYDTIPYTNRTVEYWLTLEETDCAPDGYQRKCVMANGTIPGPPIVADWGDDIVVHVTNNIATNGSSLHWHGARLLNNNIADGTPGVTQCPIAPGKTQTYKFHADQYGTSWYHSHFSMQYSNGLYGALIINGPATADYDEDLGAVFITDWDHETTDYIWATLADGNVTYYGSDTGLFNGMNTGDCVANNATNLDPRCLGEGKKFELLFEEGKKYRLRLLNVAEEDWVQFSIDNHTMTVIATDFVPIVPYQTTNIFVGMGQRYDVIIEANAPPGDYWMRSGFEHNCILNGAGADNITAIVRYNNESTAMPTNSSVNTVVIGLAFCLDEQPTNLEPWVPIDLEMSSVKDGVQTETFKPEWLDNHTHLRWSINGGSFMWVNWSNPALGDVISGNLDAIPLSDNVFQVGANTSSAASQSDETEWAILVIEDHGPIQGISHPMHLHGHDFLILAAGYEQWSGSTYGWQLKNPPRRDTATLPANGYLAIAWPLDNPGVWAFHCHIAWHSSQGFGATVVESPALIPGVVGGDWTKQLDPVCDAWDAWEPTMPFPQADAGI
ncbi:hypothetical protein N7467_004923 [Penicillium canescens]|nr:hypothetical protein N7467_004923 [Penicillium canescens]